VGSRIRIIRFRPKQQYKRLDIIITSFNNNFNKNIDPIYIIETIKNSYTENS
jgi:hypothetical protein